MSDDTTAPFLLILLVGTVGGLLLGRADQPTTMAEVVGVVLVVGLVLFIVVVMAADALANWRHLHGGVGDADERTAKSTEQAPTVHGASGEDLTAAMRAYPRVGEYILSRISGVYSPEPPATISSSPNSEIVVEVEAPTGSKTWSWDIPLSWSEEQSTFVKMVHNYGLSRENFDELEGQPVLIKSVDGTKTLHLTPPEEAIPNWLEDGDVTWDEIEVGAIQEQFDLDIKVDGRAVEAASGIVVEKLPDEFIDT